MRKFDVKQGELTIEGQFAKPSFRLPTSGGSPFVELLYGQLSRFGVTPNDITFGMSGSLADRYVLFYLPRIAAGIKASLAKLEIGFNDLSRVTFSDISALASAAFEAIAKSDPEQNIVVFGATITIHGIVDGLSPVDFLKSHISKPPDGLGPSTGGAVGFYYGGQGPRQMLSVIMDGSAAYPGTVYVRITIGFDGRQITQPQVFVAARDAARKAFTAVGLQPTPLDLGTD